MSSDLAPSDVVVALRSLPRRFRAALATPGDDHPDDLPHRAGPEGVAAIDHLVEAITALSVLDRAVEMVLSSDDPVLHAGVTDPAERQVARQLDATGRTVDDVLADLEAIVASFSARVDAVRADDWLRRARVAGRDAPVRAIDLIRTAVDESINRLDATKATMQAARSAAGVPAPDDDQS